MGIGGLGGYNPYLGFQNNGKKPVGGGKPAVAKDGGKKTETEEEKRAREREELEKRLKEIKEQQTLQKNDTTGNKDPKTAFDKAKAEQQQKYDEWRKSLGF